MDPAKRMNARCSFWVLFTLFAFADCTAIRADDPPPPVPVACVGDSITFGAGLAERDCNSYPAQLQQLLGEEYEVQNFGVNGATVLKKGDYPYWHFDQYKRALAYQPQLVIIQLGSNDTKPVNWQHHVDFKSDYVDLVRSFQKLDSTPKVCVCLPPPVFPERWGLSDAMIRNEVIPSVQAVAKETGAKCIDLHSSLADKPELFPDQVHPNMEGSKRIAEIVYAALREEALISPARAPAANPTLP